jgi:hypothetical protein
MRRLTLTSEQCGFNKVHAILAPGAICVFLFGMVMLDPPITAMRLAPFGEQVGAASVMLGFLQILGASLGKTLFTKGSHF